MSFFDHNLWEKNVRLKNIITNVSDGDIPTEYRTKELTNTREKTYGIRDFVYDHNENGFRGCSFSKRGKVTILVLGDSFTYGVGLPEEHIWWHQIKEQLSGDVVFHNLSLGGSGTSYISSVYRWYLNTYGAPDYVLYCLSSLERQNIPHHIETNGTVHSDFFISADFELDSPIKDIHPVIPKIYTKDTDNNRSMMHIRLVDSWTKEAGSHISYCSWAIDTIRELLEYKDDCMDQVCAELFRKPLSNRSELQFLDPKPWGEAREKFPQTIARDFMHLGPRPHYVFAQAYLKHLMNKPKFAGLFE